MRENELLGRSFNRGIYLVKGTFQILEKIWVDIKTKKGEKKDEN